MKNFLRLSALILTTTVMHGSGSNNETKKRSNSPEIPASAEVASFNPNNFTTQDISSLVTNNGQNANPDMFGQRGKVTLISAVVQQPQEIHSDNDETTQGGRRRINKNALIAASFEIALAVGIVFGTLKKESCSIQ